MIMLMRSRYFGSYATSVSRSWRVGIFSSRTWVWDSNMDGVYLSVSSDVFMVTAYSDSEGGSAIRVLFKKDSKRRW
jgi:hypothetical protein